MVTPTRAARARACPPSRPPARAWPLCFLALIFASGAHAIGFDEALKVAQEQAPSLSARRAAVEGATAERVAAGRLPNPELKLGIDNLPVSGPDAGSLQADSMTMRRLGWMQSVPAQAKRAAQQEVAEARIVRARAQETADLLKVKRETAMAWLQAHFARRQLDLFSALEAEHRMLASTMSSRVASGQALAAEASMATLQGADLQTRREELQLQLDKAQMQLQRWLGQDATADGPLPDWLLGEAATDAMPPSTWEAQLAPADADIAAAQADLREAVAARQGDWSWEVGWGKRAARYGDMLSFQVSLELPTSQDTRQAPLIAARTRDLDRLSAEREDALRRLTALARIQRLEIAQLRRAWLRQRDESLPLTRERVRLQTASYEAGRADLGSVLAARHDAAEAALRVLDTESRLAQAQAALRYLILE